MSSTPKTAILFVDPYNDFLHKDGKLTSRLGDTLEKNNTISHMKDLVAAARKHHLPIFYGLHQHWTPELYKGWHHMSSSNSSQDEVHFFEEGSWGGEVLDGLEPQTSSGDVVASKHFNSNAFWNTDLDYQLRQRHVTHLALAGLTANTYLEATGRHAMGCGYNVTMLYDATAAWNVALMDAARDLTYALFANEVLATDQWLAKLKGQKSNL